MKTRSKTAPAGKRSDSKAGDGAYRRIDCHAHPARGPLSSFRGSPSAYVNRIRKQGIDAIVLLAPGEVCKKAVAKFGRDFIIPVAMYRLRNLPGQDMRKDMAYWLEHGCKGIKFIAPLHPYSDERYWPMYQVVNDHKAVAIFHTGFLAFRGPEPEIPPVQMHNMRAAHIDTITRRFPTLKILMAHFSNPWWEEAWKVSWTRPNVYADLSGGTAFQRSLTMWAETFAPNGELMERSLQKLCFATDVRYLHSGEHGFQPYIEFYERLLNRIRAPQRLRKAVWSGTAAKLFGVR